MINYITEAKQMSDFNSIILHPTFFIEIITWLPIDELFEYICICKQLCLLFLQCKNIMVKNEIKIKNLFEKSVLYKNIKMLDFCTEISIHIPCYDYLTYNDMYFYNLCYLIKNKKEKTPQIYYYFGDVIDKFNSTDIKLFDHIMKLFRQNLDSHSIFSGILYNLMTVAITFDNIQVVNYFITCMFIYITPSSNDIQRYMENAIIYDYLEIMEMIHHLGTCLNSMYFNIAIDQNKINAMRLIYSWQNEDLEKTNETYHIQELNYFNNLAFCITHMGHSNYRIEIFIQLLEWFKDSLTIEQINNLKIHADGNIVILNLLNDLNSDSSE